MVTRIWFSKIIKFFCLNLLLLTLIRIKFIRCIKMLFIAIVIIIVGRLLLVYIVVAVKFVFILILN